MHIKHKTAQQMLRTSRQSAQHLFIRNMDEVGDSYELYNSNNSYNSYKSYN
jgi:hypothetical protein